MALPLVSTECIFVQLILQSISTKINIQRRTKQQKLGEDSLNILFFDRDDDVIKTG